MNKNYGTAGRSTREMAQKRYNKVGIYAGIIFILVIIWLWNFNNLIRLGLPAIVFLGIIFNFVTDEIEKNGLQIKKRAKDADRGAYAEEVVAERLKELPEGYQVFNDITFEGFNIDHVAVGPGGIFLVETKSHKGNVDAKGDTLLLNGAQPSKNFLNQAWRQAYQLRDFIKKHSSKEWNITPVLCFTRAFVKIRQPIKGIAVVNGKYLSTYLSRQSKKLSSEDIEIVTRILHDRFS